jgi:hypothetical protein
MLKFPKFENLAKKIFVDACLTDTGTAEAMATVALPIIPAVSGEELSFPSDADFLSLNSLSRNQPRQIPRANRFAAARELALEPVGPHFLAHARRKRHNRTFSEDEKHQAEVHALSLEDKSGNVSEDSEPEDEDMLTRDPKEWKVTTSYRWQCWLATGTRPLCCSRLVKVPIQGDRWAD